MPLLGKKVLSFYLPVRQLLSKSMAEVASLTYLYSRAVQHRDDTEDAEALARWSSGVAVQTAPGVAALTWQQKLVIEYVKSRCHDAQAFAVPECFMNDDEDSLAHRIA